MYMDPFVRGGRVVAVYERQLLIPKKISLASDVYIATGIQDKSGLRHIYLRPVRRNEQLKRWLADLIKLPQHDGEGVELHVYNHRMRLPISLLDFLGILHTSDRAVIIGDLERGIQVWESDEFKRRIEPSENERLNWKITDQLIAHYSNPPAQSYRHPQGS